MPRRRDLMRALVGVMKGLAVAYGLVIPATNGHTASEEDVKKSYTKLVRKVHPDKGGNNADFRKLQAAYEGWRSAEPQVGRPSARADEEDGAAGGDIVVTGVKKTYDIRASAVMLTYQGIQDVRQWDRFVEWVKGQLRVQGIKHWCATLEACPKTQRLHIHLMVEFHTAKDSGRTVADFKFENLGANASNTDYLGEGVRGGRNFRMSVDRGLFYVFVDKIGTIHRPCGSPCVCGNRGPAWAGMLSSYAPRGMGRWAENLFRKRLLTQTYYDELIVLCRDNVPGLKRNLDAVVAGEAALADKREMAEVTERLAKIPHLNRPYKTLPEVEEWKATLKEDRDRFPILIVHGGSLVGKTRYAMSLFPNPLLLRIGILPATTWPDQMRGFRRSHHGAIVLDDVRDLSWIALNQDRLQGSNCMTEFGTTPGGGLKHEHYLYRVPMIATINNSTANLDLLTEHDWLGNSGNRVLLTLAEAPYLL